MIAKYGHDLASTQRIVIPFREKKHRTKRLATPPALPSLIPPLKLQHRHVPSVPIAIDHAIEFISIDHSEFSFVGFYVSKSPTALNIVTISYRQNGFG
jgi:hypothetical protein